MNMEICKCINQDKYSEFFEIIEIEYVFNLTNHQLAQLFTLLRMEDHCRKQDYFLRP